MVFKPRADHFSHTLTITRHCCNLDVWALAQSHGDGYRSLLTQSEYNEDFIFLFDLSFIVIIAVI